MDGGMDGFVRRWGLSQVVQWSHPRRFLVVAFQGTSVEFHMSVEMIASVGSRERTEARYAVWA